jgi:hypothetical protein
MQGLVPMLDLAKGVLRRLGSRRGPGRRTGGGGEGRDGATGVGADGEEAVGEGEGDDAGPVVPPLHFVPLAKLPMQWRGTVHRGATWTASCTGRTLNVDYRFKEQQWAKSIQSTRRRWR